MTVSVDHLRMAALLLNIQHEMPKLLSILKGFDANRISEVKEADRLACLLACLEAKMLRRHAMWRMTS